jgi:hypothetical protein
MPRRTWALVLAFIVSLPAVTPRLYASDEIEYYSFLRSLWFDHDLSFDDEYRYFADHAVARGPGFRETFLELTTPTGLRYNFGTIGSAILWTPMYAAADIGVRIARAAGSHVAADGYSRPYIAAVAYGSALYGFLALLLSASVAERLSGQGAAACTLIWVGSPLAFYMYLAPGMAHACSAFAVAAFVATWLVVRRDWSARGMAVLGGLAALMTMVREQDAFFAAGPALDYLLTLRAAAHTADRQPGAPAGAIAAGIAAFVVVFLPQAWAYQVLNGHIGPARVIADKMYWQAPHAVQVLFSAEHGLFAWTPLALLALVGLAVGVLERSRSVGHGLSDRRQVLLCLLVMFLAQVYVSGSVDTWTVAGSFGQRRFTGATIVLAVGLATMLMRAGRQRVVVLVLAAVCVWWNIGLMVQFGAGMMDRQQLDLKENAFNTFIRVPLELPALGYRYLFNRSSFYKAPSH